MPRPSNVGILAMEVYFPKRFVAQVDLEAADGCTGKYTSGLGQQRLAFVDDREDIGSVMLSAVSALLEKYDIDPNSVGRLEVGTETLIDKSKSVKTTLLRLFPDNTSLEGVSSTNACYGGTAALLNSVAWVQSEDWDGRYAIVVAGDIAVYEAPEGSVCGSARATQGCGAVALLVGPDAPLALEPKLRHTHAMDVYDFYKPHHSEYAAVDGAVSQNCYLRSVDACYRGVLGKLDNQAATAAAATPPAAASLGSFDFFCFHSPYHKLVAKGFARLKYVDFLNQSSDGGGSGSDALLAPFVPETGEKAPANYEASLEDKGLDASLRKACAKEFTQKLEASSSASIQVGNCYTGAVFLNLLSLVCSGSSGVSGSSADTASTGSDASSAADPSAEPCLLLDAKGGQRIGVFSYGSGSVATLYCLRTRVTTSPFSLDRIQRVVGLQARLAQRTQASVQEFSAAMDLRADRYGKCGYEPTGSIEHVPAGAFFLSQINGAHHRTYERKA